MLHAAYAKSITIISNDRGILSVSYSEWCNSLSVSLSTSTVADVSSSVAANTCPDITLYRE